MKNWDNICLVIKTKDKEEKINHEVLLLSLDILKKDEFLKDKNKLLKILQIKAKDINKNLSKKNKELFNKYEFLEKVLEKITKLNNLEIIFFSLFYIDEQFLVGKDPLKKFFLLSISENNEVFEPLLLKLSKEEENNFLSIRNLEKSSIRKDIKERLLEILGENSEYKFFLKKI